MLNSIKALTFDTGGTILDWHTGLCQAFAQAGAQHGLSADWPEITNEYRRRSLKMMVSAVNPSFNIEDVHRRVLDAVIEEFEITALTAEDRESIWQKWHALDTWPDFPPALARLKTKYVVVSFTILSTSLVIDVSRRNGLTWDCIVSCEMIGTYKTQPQAYRTCAQWLGYRPDELLMVACHNFDLMAARAEGYLSAFVHRPAEWGPAGPPDPVPNPAHDIIAQDFTDLATQLGV
jgi:2-haloacid dehalogenase